MSILHMVKCPDTGGDTMWSSLYQAYEELSPPMQELCDGLTALHDALPHNHPEQMAIHPVVRLHPETGRKALYVNEHFTRRIVEMNASESDALLRYLTRWEPWVRPGRLSATSRHDRQLDQFLRQRAEAS